MIFRIIWFSKRTIQYAIFCRRVIGWAILLQRNDKYLCWSKTVEGIMIDGGNADCIPYDPLLNKSWDGRRWKPWTMPPCPADALSCELGDGHRSLVLPMPGMVLGVSRPSFPQIKKLPLVDSSHRDLCARWLRLVAKRVGVITRNWKFWQDLKLVTRNVFLQLFLVQAWLFSIQHLTYQATYSWWLRDNDNLG